MPAEISVSDDDIAYAERILLPPGESFDEERKCFIRSMRTLDLQAVPGSGKTTALLAKLLILDRCLPFEDGSGILVISHTNAAIDEIRNRIGAHCTNLFRYPNFVGTIQGFVDEFLAVPFYANKYGRLPTRIDDDIHNQRFSDPPFGFQGFTTQENKNARRFLVANLKKIRLSVIDGRVRPTEGYCGKVIDFKKPRGNTKPQNYVDWNDAEKDRVRQWVLAFKLAIMKSGCLCYDDAYFLARLFLTKNRLVKMLLQKRFTHVFVDEMQDMEQHQYALLEDIFHDEGKSLAAYQRIGDRNQAIFEGKASSANEFWSDRVMTLELKGSYRLSPILASIVRAFAVVPIQIEGRRKNPDGSDVSIKPRFIIYSESTKQLVIPRFASIIRQLEDGGAIPVSPCNRYKAIAWATKQESGKIRLPDYHPPFSKAEQQKRIDCPGLSSHLTPPNGDDHSLTMIAEAIGNALLQILRLEKVEDSAGAHFTKRTMHEFLRDTNPDYWTQYQSKVYEWCIGVARADTSAVLADVRNHLPTFLSAFGRQIDGSRDFICSQNNSGAIPAAGEAKCNVLVSEGLAVEIATVHRVKGETHAATLYMETFYEKGAGGNYESERLLSQFKGQALGVTIHDLVRQSAKMVYVGFSRPTHLLCFAVHESRFANFERDIDRSIWEVVRL